jgi:hypothetical protein
MIDPHQAGRVAAFSRDQAVRRGRVRRVFTAGPGSLAEYGLTALSSRMIRLSRVE